MKLILKNNSSDTYTFGSVSVNANSNVEIDQMYWYSLFTDVDFLINLKLNNILINNGIDSNDLGWPESKSYIEWLSGQISFYNRDTDGAQIVRVKAAKKGWTFLALPVEITTSSLNTLYCKYSNGTDVSGITCKIYDGNDAEITTPGALNINLNNCVKTVLDIELPFDYELVAGVLRVSTVPTQDIRLWIVGAPDIPSNLGGSKEFASGINLKFLGSEKQFEIDGRVAKYIYYNPATHTGKVRLLFKHTAGLQVSMQAIIHMYRL